MVEPSPHEACSGVTEWRVGYAEILCGLLEQLVLVDRASGIETEKVWAVNPHTNRIALDALNHHFGNRHTLVRVLGQQSGRVIPESVVARRGNMPNAVVLVHEQYAPS